MLRSTSSPRRRAGSRRPGAVAAVLLAFAAIGVHANDRPFQSARTAIAEDDEGSWSFESWVQRFGPVRGYSFEPEYVFTDRFSVQLELTRLVDRRDEETGHEAEVEFKYLFNDIARDGWGAGVSLALSGERTLETRRRHGGTTGSATLKLPVSLALGDNADRYLHLNASIGKADHDKRALGVAAAFEQEVGARSWLFAELSRVGAETYGQVGVRHWLKREKLAIDFALQQYRHPGERASGFIVGIGLYDY